ncbi:MAG: NeuD/PglB/VioB family sugar acetyltransferase [Bacteroidota bacterium]|nr:NeuD/PglB/VioB family sugar acetyltransferase [Bacteroidota bacterium]
MLIYGGNGFTKLVIDSLESQSIKIDGIFDDEPLQGSLDNYTYLGKYHNMTMKEEEILVAREDNILRKYIAESITHKAGKIAHSSAHIYDNVQYGPGSIILHHSAILPDVKIGTHVIINAGAIVERDTVIDDFVTIGQSSTICSNVKLELGSYVGPSATVLSNVKVGKWASIAAGSVIINDVPDFAIVVGNPGKIVKYRDMKIVKGKQGIFTPYR